MVKTYFACSPLSPKKKRPSSHDGVIFFLLLFFCFGFEKKKRQDHKTDLGISFFFGTGKVPGQPVLDFFFFFFFSFPGFSVCGMRRLFRVRGRELDVFGLVMIATLATVTA